MVDGDVWLEKQNTTKNTTRWRNQTRTTHLNSIDGDLWFKTKLYCHGNKEVENEAKDIVQADDDKHGPGREGAPEVYDVCDDS